MSINDFMNKIKGKLGLDKTTLMFLCIIIGVGASSFGLGRLSVAKTSNDESLKLEDKNIGIVNGEIGNSLKVDNNSVGDSTSKERVYVASKNGKMYYSLGCSGASRIKLENQIWFSTSLDAEKSGYSKSTSCN